MSAGTAYSKRYGAGFVDLPTQTTPVDQQFLNAVETALLQLLGAAPTVDGQVAQWDNVNTRYGPALLLNKNIDPAAAIAKSKLDFTGANGIVDADVAGAAAIARSKLNFGAGLVNADIAAAAAIAITKLSGFPTDAKKVLLGDGTWGTWLHMIRGRVTSAGAVAAGTGFTITKLGVGNYQINFTVAFAATPVVIAIPGNTGGLVTSAEYGNPGTGSVQVFTSDVTANAVVDCEFMFVAMDF